MENKNELILSKDITEDLYDRIKNYVGDEWREDYSKHFFYIDAIRKPPLYFLVFEIWNYKIKIPNHKDLKVINPNETQSIQIPIEALKILN